MNISRNFKFFYRPYFPRVCAISWHRTTWTQTWQWVWTYCTSKPVANSVSEPRQRWCCARWNIGRTTFEWETRGCRAGCAVLLYSGEHTTARRVQETDNHNLTIKRNERWSAIKCYLLRKYCQTYALSPGVQVVAELPFTGPFPCQHLLLLALSSVQHVVQIR